MKITRNTKCKRIMKFYSKNFGFREPYNIIVDGTFCNEALQHKVQIEEQLKTYFGAELNIFTTQCCIAEIELLTRINFGLQGGWLILKRFRTVRCGHEGKPLKAGACLAAVVRGGRYILATMSTELRNTVNAGMAGVPVMYLYGPAPTLLKPGEQSVLESGRGGNEVAQRTKERLAEIKAALLLKDGREMIDNKTPKKRKGKRSKKPKTTETERVLSVDEVKSDVASKNVDEVKSDEASKKKKKNKNPKVESSINRCKPKKKKKRKERHSSDMQASTAKCA